MQWHAQDLWEQLEPLLPELSIEVLARTTSTNGELIERARQTGVPSEDAPAAVRPSVESRAFAADAAALRRRSDLQPCLLVAEHQTAGRGRQGRSWEAAPGSSLTFSLALPLNPQDWSGLSLAVGVALVQALQPAPAPQGLRLMLKWPNDLWLVDAQGDGDGRKLGGILIETVSAGSRRLAIVGIGLNVLPLPGAEVRGRAALQEIDPAATPPAVLACIARPLVQALQQFEREGFAPFAAGFAARDMLAGRAVTLSPAKGEPWDGMAQGVASNGGLLVRTASGLQTVTSGEVSVRPSAGPTVAARRDAVP